MERPISYNLLIKDELIYEVEIRDAIPEATVVALKDQVRKLAKDIPADEIIEVDRDSASELECVARGLSELSDFFEQAKVSFKKFNRIKAFAHHLFHRLGRVQLTTKDLADQHAAVDETLQGLLKRVDSLYSSFNYSFKQAQDSVEQATTEGSPSAASSLLPASRDDYGVSKQMKALTILHHKYDGATCVRVYLERLEELCTTRRISHQVLLQGAAELFSDRALQWYRGVKAEHAEWTSLKSALVEEYSPLEYDKRLLKEINLRTQGDTETSSDFISVMLNYYSRLDKPVLAEDKLQTIRYNLRPRLITALALESIKSLKDLKIKCRLLEHSISRAADFKEPPKSTTLTVAPDLAFVHKQPQRVELVQPAVSEDVAAIMQPNFCIRCRIQGHRLNDCTSRELVCFSCGKKGVRSTSCPDCKKKKAPTPAVTAGPRSESKN